TTTLSTTIVRNVPPCGAVPTGVMFTKSFAAPVLPTTSMDAREAPAASVAGTYTDATNGFVVAAERPLISFGENSTSSATNPSGPSRTRLNVAPRVSVTTTYV